MPAMPMGLSREAAKEWRRVAPLLVEARYLIRVDGDALAVYCQTFAGWLDVQKQIDRGGLTYKARTGRVYPNPLLRTEMKLANLLLQYTRKLGMTPLARATMTRRALATGAPQ
jgi:P27 family predicted phage terminase small subunit